MFVKMCVREKEGGERYWRSTIRNNKVSYRYHKQRFRSKIANVFPSC